MLKTWINNTVTVQYTEAPDEKGPLSNSMQKLRFITTWIQLY